MRNANGNVSRKKYVTCTTSSEATGHLIHLRLRPDSLLILLRNGVPGMLLNILTWRAPRAPLFSLAPPTPVRLATRKVLARFESCEAVPKHLAVAWHSRRAAWMLRHDVACSGAPPSPF